MATTKSTGQTSGSKSNKALGNISSFKVSFAANFAALYTVILSRGSAPGPLNQKIHVHAQIILDVLRMPLLTGSTSQVKLLLKLLE